MQPHRAPTRCRTAGATFGQDRAVAREGQGIRLGRLATQTVGPSARERLTTLGRRRRHATWQVGSLICPPRLAPHHAGCRIRSCGPWASDLCAGHRWKQLESSNVSGVHVPVLQVPRFGCRASPLELLQASTVHNCLPSSRRGALWQEIVESEPWRLLGGRNVAPFRYFLAPSKSLRGLSYSGRRGNLDKSWVEALK